VCSLSQIIILDRCKNKETKFLTNYKVSVKIDSYLGFEKDSSSCIEFAHPLDPM
jgi:hypothetical protein